MISVIPKDYDDPKWITIIQNKLSAPLELSDNWSEEEYAIQLIQKIWDLQDFLSNWEALIHKTFPEAMHSTIIEEVLKDRS